MQEWFILAFFTGLFDTGGRFMTEMIVRAKFYFFELEGASRV
jgi:hypothetical protein